MIRRGAVIARKPASGCIPLSSRVGSGASAVRPRQHGAGLPFNFGMAGMPAWPLWQHHNQRYDEGKQNSRGNGTA